MKISINIRDMTYTFTLKKYELCVEQGIFFQPVLCHLFIAGSYLHEIMRSQHWILGNFSDWDLLLIFQLNLAKIVKHE